MGSLMMCWLKTFSLFLAQQPALNSFALVPPSLPSPGGARQLNLLSVQLNLFEALQEVVQEILGRAMASGRFIFVDSDLKLIVLDKPSKWIVKKRR
ncbi:hypothetical protein ACT691_06865 [Vibrio metschnikovii]